MAWTNKGKFQVFQMALSNATEPTALYLALCTDAATPTVDTNVFSSLFEIAAGNGYVSGGISLTRNSTNFPSTEDDTNDRASIDIPDQAWTASGGSIPASGSGARYAILTDDNGTIGNREVYCWWDLTSNRTVSVSQVLTVQNLLLYAT